MTSPRPGWYPDPAGTPELFRWWDGASWTEAIGESPHAPAPGVHILQAASLPGTRLLEATDRLADQESVAAYAGSNRSPAQVVIAATVSFALLVTAGLGVGIVLWRDSPTAAPEPGVGGQQASQAATLNPMPSHPPMGQVDEKTGRAKIDSATMTLPTDPYQIYGGSIPIDGLFDIFFVSNATVHGRYDGSDDWSATVGLAHMSISEDEDLETTGKEAVTGIISRFFGSHPVTLSDGGIIATTIDGRPAIKIDVDVNYKITKLSSTHDDLSVTILRLDEDSLIVAISSVPNDASPQLQREAAESLASLDVS